MQNLTQSDAFNLQQFGYFLDRLSEMCDADSLLLDSTIALYGSGMAFGHRHGNANLLILVAGGRGIGLRHGRHINLTHPHRLSVTPTISPTPDGIMDLPQSGNPPGMPTFELPKPRAC